ncbi:MAG TPA: hypothetical protein VLG49_03570, partial [Rhabdochlamydiaceae bacterium]|nr:hypothetical protein [Rhabdochlamydiaceae bacterium]
MFLFFFCNILLCLSSIYGKVDLEKKRSQFVPANSDKLLFGKFWSSIRGVYVQNKLNEAIAERRAEIEWIKEHWRERILYFQQGPSQEFYDEIDQIIQPGRLERIHAGEGSAYFLFDLTGNPHFVVKPIDEDLLCLNNCKYYGNPLNSVSMRVRMHIPLYRSHQTDVMAYEFAKEILDLPNITPKTVMSIVFSPIFFDLSDLLEGKEKEDFLCIGGKPDKEKLCSVQAFISNASNMVEIVGNWLDADLSDEDIESRLDQDDFEDAILFVWTTYDNDAHAG